MVLFDIKKKIEKIRAGELSAVENVNYFLNRIERYNKEYNIFLDINKEKTLKRAEEIDKRIKTGKEVGKLAGLCFAIKANINVKDLTISCASKTLENYKGSYDADVIKRIKEEDGIILGIVNCDEFACGSSGETSAFGVAINPFSPKRIPGGSSSGSAAAVSLGLCDVALGSDTGGSIRNPASHCNVIGIKPSYGRVSRYGLIDLSMSLDQIGPLSNDLYGSALVLEVISGKSDKDATTFDKKVLEYTKSINFEEGKKFKIGVIKELESMILDDEIKEAYNELLTKLKKNYDVVELHLNYIKLGVAAYYPIVYTEFFSGTRKFDGIKYGGVIEELAGAEVLRRILGGKEISRSEYEGTYYRKALRVKELIRKEFEDAFSKVDFIVSPVTPKLPHKLGEKLSVEDMYNYDAFTIPANLSGICGGVINYKVVSKGDEKIAIGMQVLAGAFNETKMFKGLKVIEELK